MTLVQVTARPVDHPIEKDMLSPSQTTNNDSEYFYEREAEYFGSTPFQLLDEIGEIVVGAAFKMFDSAPTIIGEIIPFLDKGQLTAVLFRKWCLELTCYLFLLVNNRDWDNGLPW